MMNNDDDVFGLKLSFFKFLGQFLLVFFLKVGSNTYVDFGHQLKITEVAVTMSCHYSDC